jgi:hypothetical protein
MRMRTFLILAYCSGIAIAIDRVDQSMVKGDLAGSSTLSALMHSWPSRWTMLLTFGVLYAALVGWIAGWL